MKHKEIVKEFHTMTIVELQEKVDSLRRELFGLRLNAATSHVKDYSRIGKLRRGIAQALTVLTLKSRTH